MKMKMKMKMKSSGFAILCSTALLVTGCATTSDEVKDQMQAHNLDRNQVCRENGLLLTKSGECNMFNVIKDAHIQYSLSLRQAEIKKEEERLDFIRVCKDTGGYLDGRGLERRCYVKSGYGGNKANFAANDKEGLIEFINNEKVLQKSQNTAWIKEAETYNTIEELCGAFKYSRYNSEKRTCQTHDQIMGMQGSPSEIKLNIMLPVVHEKDVKIAEQEIASNVTKWKKEARLFNSTVKQLCLQIRDQYNTHFANFVKETQACELPHGTAQMKYDTMMPTVKARQPEINKKQRDLLKKNQLHKQSLEKKETAMWADRKANTHQLTTGRSYNCLSVWTKTPFQLDLGNRSAQISHLSFNLIDRFELFTLYRGVSGDGTKLTILKVYTESGIDGIDGGYVNVELDDRPVSCTS